MNEWIDIGAVADVPVLGSRVVQAPGGDIAVFKAADGTLFALRDRCPHKGGPLSQGIVHGHFFVNGIKVTSPSYQLRQGDVITVRKKEPIYNLYKGVISEGGANTPDWVTFDSETLRATVLNIPGPNDFSLPVDVNIVVEFLSR